MAKQISLESGVFSSISHESGISFRLKRMIFNELSLVFALLELPGAAFLELRGNSPSGNEWIVRNLGHLPSGGTVDDDDDTPGYPPPPTPSRPGKKYVVRLGSSLRP